MSLCMCVHVCVCLSPLAADFPVFCVTCPNSGECVVSDGPVPTALCTSRGLWAGGVRSYHYHERGLPARGAEKKAL